VNGETLRQLVVPAYLFLCLTLGGSAQAIWGNLTLQLLAVLLIAWAFTYPVATLTKASRPLLVLVVLTLVLVGLQLIPLPPELWTQLPGRNLLVSGYGSLNQQLPWLPVSMTPYETLSSALLLLPPIAVIVAVLRLRAYREIWVACAILAATICGILLGYLQITSGRSADWYLYGITNLGSAVGFFANRNHMGTLLLIAIPFSVALIARAMTLDRKSGVPLMIVAGAALLAIFAGIAMNGSFAAVVLSVPVLLASALLVPGMSRFRTLGLSAVGIGLIGALVYLANSPVQSKLTGTETTSFTGRGELWNVTLSAIGAMFPIGSGFGSFENVYQAFEEPFGVAHYYVNDAHNDYLQVLLEGGIAAALLMILALVWWIRSSVRVWASAHSLFARAASIASGVVILHSVVDYPARTTAIAAVFACCLALLARNPVEPVETPQRDEDLELRPSRHLRIG
jgi:O-antigen ligase